MVGVPGFGTAASPHQETVLHDGGKLVGETADLLIKFNALVARQDAVDFGNLLFYRFTEAWAVRIRYFISGGSALNDKVQRDFQGLGFTILEGSA